MKKKISMLLAIALLIGAFCMTSASAVAERTANDLGSSILTVKYNGSAVTFPDAQPFVDENNRTLIPLRAVTETMGADVDWIDATKTATIEQNGIFLQVPVGRDTFTVTQNGETSTVKMDTAAIISEERTYVPIRFVAEALGAWVGYSDLFTTVQIYRDILTPTEITRLHGYYDRTYREYFFDRYGEMPPFTDEYQLLIYPEYAYFIGKYGFENANEWGTRYPSAVIMNETPRVYTGLKSGLTYQRGVQTELDFAQLLIAEADGLYDFMTSQGKVQFDFRSDLSCVHSSRHGTLGMVVRGILTATIPTNADISWIKENYRFIENPQPGTVVNMDVEVFVKTTETTVRVDGFDVFEYVK